jgi:1-acyl-sn-glycerol-3-phosphate acyltransferase
LVKERARQVVRAGGFAGLTAAMLPGLLAALAAAREDRRELVRERWVRRWARALLDLFAIEVVVDGDVPPPSLSRLSSTSTSSSTSSSASPIGSEPARGRLVVSNHRSAIDIGVLLATFGGTMVSRADLARWPLVGAAARAAGTVFVDRKDAKSGAATIRAVQKHLEAGRTIAIFPEGTTFDGDDVRPFHGGAFIAAARAGAEILPVGLAYPSASGAAFVDETFPAHLARLSRAAPTRMVVSAGAPFVADRSVPARALTDRTHAAVATLVSRARTLCGP